jgi:ferritin-like protein
MRAPRNPFGRKPAFEHSDEADIGTGLGTCYSLDRMQQRKPINEITQSCDGVDYVTQDMVNEILGGEEEHRREVIGFLNEYEK